MFVYFYNFSVFWDSCLFRKIHKPFTDIFMTQVLTFSEERKQRGAPGAAGTLVCTSVGFTVP